MRICDRWTRHQSSEHLRIRLWFISMISCRVGAKKNSSLHKISGRLVKIYTYLVGDPEYDMLHFAVCYVVQLDISSAVHVKASAWMLAWSYHDFKRINILSGGYRRMRGSVWILKLSARRQSFIIPIEIDNIIHHWNVQRSNTKKPPCYNDQKIIIIILSYQGCPRQNPTNYAPDEKISSWYCTVGRDTTHLYCFISEHSPPFSKSIL